MGAFFLAPDAVAVDVLPCSGVGEGEVIRPDSHHGAVLLVLVVRVECLHPERLADGPRPWRCPGQERPRDGAQWVEEEVVDDEAHLVGQDLLLVSLKARYPCLVTSGNLGNADGGQISPRQG